MRGARAGSAKQSRGRRPDGKGGDRTVRGSTAPITLFVALIVVVFGLVQLLSTFHTYALNLSELNALRNEEAALIEQKQELENDIARWSDDAYVTAQARERLGFVFPGERSVRVLHAEAVTGHSTDADAGTDERDQSEQTTVPWYDGLLASIDKADARQTDDSDSVSGGGGSSDGISGESDGGQQGADTQNDQEGQ